MHQTARVNIEGAVDNNGSSSDLIRHVAAGKLRKRNYRNGMFDDDLVVQEITAYIYSPWNNTLRMYIRCARLYTKHRKYLTRLGLAFYCRERHDHKVYLPNQVLHFWTPAGQSPR